MTIKDAERALDAAKRRANAPFIAEVERNRRLADVEDRERELEAAYAAADEALSGRGGRRRR